MDAASAILAMISQAAWFSAVGQSERREASQVAARDYVQSCGGQWPLRWAIGWEEAGQVVRGLDDATGFWIMEQQWRDQALTAIQAADRSDALAKLLHQLSVLGYEAVRPVVADEELARVASGAALWTLAEALTWAVAEDLLARRRNPFLPKLKLFELGHWPLGLSERSIVVA